MARPRLPRLLSISQELSTEDWDITEQIDKEDALEAKTDSPPSRAKLKLISFVRKLIWARRFIKRLQYKGYIRRISHAFSYCIGLGLVWPVIHLSDSIMLLSAIRHPVAYPYKGVVKTIQNLWGFGFGFIYKIPFWVSYLQHVCSTLYDLFIPRWWAHVWASGIFRTKRVDYNQEQKKKPSAFMSLLASSPMVIAGVYFAACFKVAVEHPFSIVQYHTMCPDLNLIDTSGGFLGVLCNPLRLFSSLYTGFSIRLAGEVCLITIGYVQKLLFEDVPLIHFTSMICVTFPFIHSMYNLMGHYYISSHRSSGLGVMQVPLLLQESIRQDGPFGLLRTWGISTLNIFIPCFCAEFIHYFVKAKLMKRFNDKWELLNHQRRLRKILHSNVTASTPRGTPSGAT